MPTTAAVPPLSRSHTSTLLCFQVMTHILHKLELKAGLLMEGHEDDYIHELEGDDVEDDTAAVSALPWKEEQRGE